MRDSLPIIDSELLTLEKPAQYLGGEKNQIVKDDTTVDVRIALAFPDTYEVGMSHLGIQILYHIINQDPAAWAERAYMPQPDMERLLRDTSRKLSSLESKRPLNQFDVLGFSLQYELCGTNILAMLDLGGMALYAKDRKDSDPLVLGGGPFSYHPEPLAPFFDMFFLGDAEEFIPELLVAVRSAKARNLSVKLAVIEALRGKDGVYIPADFEPRYNDDGSIAEVVSSHGSTVTRRLLPTMAGAPYPTKPVVPNIKTIHNRLSVEVMRGCVRGCRFCQAGYLYRPQRERPPEEILEIIKDALPETGFEEVSLLSLSTADYCSIVPVLKKLMDAYGDGDRLAVSFPSTRVDALTPEVLEQVQRVRRTGFTVAPEGGSQRLRDVINKGVSDEQILETCNNVFTMGWSGIKLYFMLGLPTETDEDLYGIVELAKRIKALPSARGKDITVSVSTLVPKPHTPFQWAAQITPEETVRKQRLLADGLRRTGVNFRYHDHVSSFLEGIFCRAGREFAPVLARAYELGCRLDAWQEHLDQDLWTQAFSDCDINPYHYLRERSVEETLPWDHLSCGIPKEYFLKEWKRAIKDRPTPDCLTTSCSICGACNYDTKKNVLFPRHESERQLAQYDLAEARPLPAEAVQRIRVRYSKDGAFRFLGHLELVQVFHRSSRRAELPVCYSLGFHPLPRLAFGPPLPLGIASSADYFDIFLAEHLAPATVVERFNQELPEGLRIAQAYEIGRKSPSLQEAFSAMRYRVEWLNTPQGPVQHCRASEEMFEPILATTLTRAAKTRKGKSKRRSQEQVFRLQDYVSDISFLPDDQGIIFTLLFDHRRACPNAIEVIQGISGLGIGECHIEKIDTYFSEPEHTVTLDPTGVGQPPTLEVAQ